MNIFTYPTTKVGEKISAPIMKLNNDIFLKLDSDFVSKKIEYFDKSSIKIYNILNKKDSDSMASDLINKLSEYAVFEVI